MMKKNCVILPQLRSFCSSFSHMRNGGIFSCFECAVALLGVVKVTIDQETASKSCMQLRIASDISWAFGWFERRSLGGSCAVNEPSLIAP